MKIFRALFLYLKLFRWQNLLIITLTMFLVRYGILMPLLESRGVDMLMPLYDFILLVVAILILAAAGYVINDYYDTDIDEINRPERKILGKQIPLKNAFPLFYTMVIAAILIGTYLSFMAGSIRLGFIFVVMALVLYYYSLKYKRLPFAGNFTVALLSAFPVGLVWLFEFFYLKKDVLVFAEMIGYFKTINTMVLAYFVFAFLVSLIREMVKDLEDVEGDREAGCRTLPIAFGITVMKKWILALSLLILVALGWAAYSLFTREQMPVAWYFSVVIGALWIYYLILLVKAKEKKDYHFISTILKIVIIAGVLSMQLLFMEF